MTLDALRDRFWISLRSFPWGSVLHVVGYGMVAVLPLVVVPMLPQAWAAAAWLLQMYSVVLMVACALSLASNTRRVWLVYLIVTVLYQAAIIVALVYQIMESVV